MKIRITILIPLILAFSTISSSFIVYINVLRSAEQHIHEEALTHITMDITRLQNILYNYLTENKLNLNGARLNLSVTAMDADTQNLFLIDENNTIVISNRYLQEGKNAAEISAYTQQHAQQVLKSNNPVIFLNKENENNLNGYFPVILQFEMSHDIPRKRLGILFIDYSLERKLKSARNEAAYHALSFGGLMLLASFLVAIILHILITQRLLKLTRASRALASGDLTVRTLIHGKDEIGELGNAFDDMAIRINYDIKRREKAEHSLYNLNQTLEHRIKERTERLEEAQRIGHIGHWSLNLTTNKIILSDEIYRIFGFNAEKTPSRDTEFFSKNIHPDDLPVFKSALQTTIKEHFKFSIDYRIIHNNKKTRWVHAEAMPKHDNKGTVTILSGTIQDITERKMYEQSLTKAKEDAEISNRSKSEFLSRMSHELRTPLNGVLGFAQLLEMTPLDEKQDSFVGEIKEAGDHLLNLIGELLDLSRIESGNLEIVLQKIDLSSIIQKAVNIIQSQATESKINLVNKCDSSYMIIADITRLKQILVNLLSNAVKYNRQNGSIIISCEKIDNIVKITIKDTGLGIPQDQQENIFIPFERVDAKYSGIDGTGIGLSISRQLVELMNGKIGVKSTLGTGSKFWIELPLANDENKS